MYLKSVWHERENLYGIKIILQNPDKRDFSLDELKRELIPIIGTGVLDCINEGYNEETGVVEFIVSSPNRISYTNVFDSLNELKLKRRRK